MRGEGRCQDHIGDMRMMIMNHVQEIGHLDSLVISDIEQVQVNRLQRERSQESERDRDRERETETEREVRDRRKKKRITKPVTRSAGHHTLSSSLYTSS
jgi:hypothetical protein